MLSSLIFAALAVAWLVVLVPMFARRRQEVSTTTDSALAARVVRRGSDARAATTVRGGTTVQARPDYVEEADGMPGSDSDEFTDERVEHDGEVVDSDRDHDYDDEADTRRVHSEDARAGRRYRPGRGGFDPEAAALAARAKYARRQRIVLILLAAAVGTALLAGFAWTPLWWVHGLVDLSVVGYLTYLRRQVHIEEDVRNRRLARMNGDRRPDGDETDYYDHEADHDGYAEYDDYDERDDEDREERADPAQRRTGTVAHLSHAEPVALDDEDPLFDELDERTWEPPYRRAAGE
ncbi:divisome protein SepX/GlpR [Bounagaea algeriensis]